MQAEIIAIGDEILVGQTIDTNSSFIAAELNAVGIRVAEKRVIADTEAAIVGALDGVAPGTRLVFMTGGLGPTKDDITKKTLLEYFGGELEFHPAVWEQIQKLFASFNREAQPVHRQQAYLPSSCRALLNEQGTAPGMHFEHQGRHYFSLPGVPYETQHLVRDRILPWLAEHFAGGQIVHRTLLTQGVPESVLAERLADFEEALPPELKLAYLPSPGQVRLRLTALAHEPEASKRLVDHGAQQVYEILGDTIFGEGRQSLEAVLGELLGRGHYRLATAESCTGGMIAHKITAVAGASQYFVGGVVAYSNALKTALLGVDPDLIERHGAVSEAVVCAMAEGAKQRLNADFAVATSGVAGPGGGTEAKPVGMVWIAVAGPRQTLARMYHFGNHRGRNIQRSTSMALDLLRKEVQKIEN